jgi:hypothetical protein
VVIVSLKGSPILILFEFLLQLSIANDLGDARNGEGLDFVLELTGRVLDKDTHSCASRLIVEGVRDLDLHWAGSRLHWDLGQSERNVKLAVFVFQELGFAGLSTLFEVIQCLNSLNCQLFIKVLYDLSLHLLNALLGQLFIPLLFDYSLTIDDFYWFFFSR